MFVFQLLEATARAVQHVLEWGESGLAVADGLCNLLKVNKQRKTTVNDDSRFRN